MRIWQLCIIAPLSLTLVASLPGLYHYTESEKPTRKTQTYSKESSEPALDRLNLKTVKNISKPTPPPSSKLPETEFELNDLSRNQKLKAQKTLRIDITSAGKSDLDRIKGVGPSTAEAIIEYRKENSIDSLEDIENVDGLGPATTQKMSDQILIDGKIPS